jgi:hypothetical protein
MSWHYLRELEGESLQDICSDGEPFVPLKSRITHAEFYCNGKLMDSYLDSLSGTMSAHSMAGHGVDESMSSAVAFHARTLVQLEKERELLESDQDSGKKWQGLLARFDQDTLSWRTVQCSLLEDLNESLQTLPPWGMTVGGELYLLPTLEQTTNESGSGLWLTPSTVDIPTRSAESMTKRLKYREKIGRKGVGAGCLSEQVEWSGTGAPVGYITKDSWPTPTANMYKGSSSAVIRKNGQDRSWQSLHYAVEQVTDIGGRLNPTWVEWLMGWPIGWTDLKPLVMDKSHCVQQQPGESSSERNA